MYVVRLLEHDKFPLVETGKLQRLDSSVIIGLERVSESQLYIQRESALYRRSRRILICSFSESRRGFSLTYIIKDPTSSEKGLLF